VPLCTATLHGKDGIHTCEVIATSLFDAAAKTMRDHYMCWWWNNEAPITIQYGEKTWTVSQSRVSEWKKAKWKNPPY
jgi:hypothetical protein